jgi:hypothetical protein
MHNKEIENELEAWLAFLSMDEPEMIVKLIETYPMFSEELRELDRNTVQYMIDVMQDEINAQKGMLDEKQLQLDEKQSMLDEQKSTINEQKNEIAELKAIIEAMKK